MTDAKLRELVNLLTVRTAESRIRWNRGETGSKYRIEFNNGGITVDKWVNKGRKIVNLSIYNKYGNKLEEFKFNDQTEPEWHGMVNKLHAVIEKKELESDFTADKIIDELK